MCYKNNTGSRRGTVGAAASSLRYYPPMSTAPLDGVLVVALEQAVAAPFATRQLADLGARIIKIERPGVGDFARAYDTRVRGASSHFAWLNRSKESLTLDIKRPESADVLLRLLNRADVFIHNLAPGAVDRLGLGVERLRTRFSRLIICTISGYGASGPYRGKKAYDLLVQGEAGFLSITGTPDAPSKAGISIADIAGGMYAYSGILTALLVRGKTGGGAVLDVSLLDALGEWMGYPAYYTMYGGGPPARTGASHATIVPYGPFPVRGGDTVYFGVQNEPEWRRFCAVVLERPALAEDVRFVSNARRLERREALHAIINEVLATLGADEVTGRLDAAEIANGRMNTVEQFIDHPQLSARNRWRDVASPVGTLRALVPPATIAGVEPIMNPIPALGEHTEAILNELGFDPGTIAAWRRLGVV
jgi:itaconate CoA-transferase